MPNEAAVKPNSYSDSKAYYKYLYSSRVSAGLCRYCERKRLTDSNTVCELHWFVNIAYKRLGDGSQRAANSIRLKFYGQDRKCPYTGIELVLGVNASLDHIKPASLYPEVSSDVDNVEWVHIDVNSAKGAMSRDQFIDFCRLVAKNATK